MRRRLTIAIIAVVAGTLGVTSVGSVLLVRRASQSTAQSELLSEAQALGRSLESRTLFNRPGNLALILRIVGRIGSYQSVAVVGMRPDGSFDTAHGDVEGAALALPSALVRPADVAAGSTVIGNQGSEVFVVFPLALDAVGSALANHIPPDEQPVVVVTRTVRSPVTGLNYFLLVASVALVVAALLAAYLARRISAPLIRAVGTTQRIAGGDLEAKVPHNDHDYPELAELAGAINTMGDHLARAKDLERQFLLSVSHELRTPLTSIQGYADAVAEGATDDVDGAVRIIGNEARRLDRLVKDLLDLARLDASRFSLNIAPVDCAAVALATVQGFARQAESLGIELESAIAHDAAMWVDADHDRLRQVLANLTENAFKYAATRVTIGAEQVGTSYALWVVDDGPGIAPDDLPHVFERHFRSDRKPSRSVGTGLGLAIVAELTAGMGATVRADSPAVDGHGTKMVLWFAPRGSAPAQSRGSERTSAENLSPPEP